MEVTKTTIKRSTLNELQKSFGIHEKEALDLLKMDFEKVEDMKILENE
jgi:hypothetical protein